MSMLTILLVSLVGSVSAYGKVGPLLGGLGSSGVVTGGSLIGGGGVIGGAGGIVSGSGLLLNNGGLGGLAGVGGLGGLGGVIGGLNTGLVGGGQPWCTCSLKCARGQIKLNKKCNLAPLLPVSLDTCCSVLPWWVTNQNHGVSLGGAGIIGGGGIVGGVSGILGGGSGLLGPIGSIGGPIGGVVTGSLGVIGGGRNVVSGYGPIGKGGY